MRTCCICGKDCSEYPTRYRATYPPIRSDAPVEFCRECYRFWNLWRHYGVSHLDVQALYERQGGRCAICGCGEEDSIYGGKQGGTQRFGVDHCHRTGRVRALLCNRCNTAVARVKEDPDLCRRLIDYLEGYCGAESGS